MPKVPTYDELQVADRPLPGARSESIATPALLSAGADDLIKLGKGLQAGGDDISKVAGQMQDRRNADVLFRAETTFKDELTQYEVAQRSKKGAAALADGGVTQQAEKWFGESLQKHSSVLENDAQRRAFEQVAGRLRSQSMGTLSVHQANESRASLTESTKATIVGSINRAAANPNDWTVLEAERKEITNRVKVLGQIEGHTAEVQAAVLGENLTMLHTQMIQQLVKSNPAAVEGYYKKYESEIDGSKRAELGDFAKKATSTSLGDGAAGAVWEAQKPKNGTEPVRLADMEQEIRTTLKGNDDAIEKGIKGLKERVASYEFQKKQEGNALEASVNGLILKGASAAQVRSSPEFISLSVKSPEDARKVLTFMENQEYTRVARAAASEQRADAAESRKERRLHRDTLDTTLRLSDPDALVALSRDQVVNLLPKLGMTNTTALLGRWDSLTKSGDKLIEARIDKQDFDTIALSAGLRPNEKAKSEDEKDRLVRLQQRVETVIDAEQRAAGNKPLTREAKQAIMQREVDNAVMVDTWGFDKKQPLGTLANDDVGKAYVVVGGREVKLTSIPPQFRQQAVAERRRQGLPTSETQLAELWLRSTGKMK